MTHNPEFSIVEFYLAYADVEDLMQLTESMISGLVEHLTGGLKIQYHPDGPTGECLELDFTTPWKRFDMISELEIKTGEKFPSGEELGSEETNKFLRMVCTKVGILCSIRILVCRSCMTNAVRLSCSTTSIAESPEQTLVC